MGGGEVELRDVVRDDLPVLFEHQRDPVALKMADFPGREREAFLAHWTRIMADAAVAKQTVVVDGRVAGNVVGWNEDGRRLVGYWIGRDYWGRGVASRALARFLQHERARPLFAYVAPHNVASIRVLEKCGFVRSRTEVAREEHADLVFVLQAADRI